MTCFVCICPVNVLRVGVCPGVRVCSFVCWNPTFWPLDLFFTLLDAAVRIMPSVSHRPSSSQAFYVVAATVQQQSHNRFSHFVTATDDTSVCACVCLPYVLRERTHNLKKGARMLRMGQSDTTLLMLVS